MTKTSKATMSEKRALVKRAKFLAVSLAYFSEISRYSSVYSPSSINPLLLRSKGSNCIFR